MTLPVALNPIAMSQVSVEIGRASNATTSLNESVVRSLAGVGAYPAAISFNNLHGKSYFALTSPPPQFAGDVESPVGTVTSYVHLLDNGYIWHNGWGNLSAYGSPAGASGVASGAEWLWYLGSGGVNYTNMSAGVWYPVGNTYYFGNQRSTNGISTGTGTYYIRRGGVQVGPGTWTIYAYRGQL